MTKLVIGDLKINEPNKSINIVNLQDNECIWIFSYERLGLGKITDDERRDAMNSVANSMFREYGLDDVFYDIYFVSNGTKERYCLMKFCDFNLIIEQIENGFCQSPQIVITKDKVTLFDNSKNIYDATPIATYKRNITKFLADDDLVDNYFVLDNIRFKFDKEEIIKHLAAK